MQFFLALLPLLLLPVPQERGDFEAWVDQLGADYQEEREEAGKNLEKAGKAAEPFLIEGVGHGDFRVRGSCITILSRLKSLSALDPVTAVFRNPREVKDVTKKAFAFLAGLGKGAEDVLIESLDRPESEFRMGALLALRKMKSTKCAAKVADLYDREEIREVKAAAFVCLKNIGKTAQPHLLKLLDSRDSTVREGAIAGLRNVNRTKMDPAVVKRVGKLFVVEVDRSVVGGAFLFLKECGKDAEPHFVAGLGSLHPDVQEKSLEGLAGLKTGGGMRAAGRLFESTGSDKLRGLAKRYLETLGISSEDIFVRALENRRSEVKLLAIDALGKIRSGKPRAVISRMFREEKDPALHQASFRYLVRLGEMAEEDLLFALEDSERNIRLEAIRTVGKIRSAEAIPGLLRFLGTLDRTQEEAAMQALVRIGEKGVEKVREEVAAGRLSAGVGDRVKAIHHREQVEVILAKLVSEQAGFGYYGGMFSGLESFGKEKALPVLHAIVEDPNYQARLLEVKGIRYEFDRALRELSIIAVGELGGEKSIPRLKKVMKVTASSGLENEFGHLVVAIYRLGDRKPFQEFISRLEKEAESALSGDLKEDGYELLFSIGLVQNRVGMRKAAEKTYSDLAERIGKEAGERPSDVYPDTLYNLACLRALRGEKAEAIKLLRRSVEAGFRDRDWIEKDGDLASLRGEAAYRALMAEKALFAEK